MKDILEHLYQHKSFSRAEAREILKDIASEKYNHSQIASFLTAFIMRDITLEEIKGFREALLDLCIPVDLSPYNVMDVCGTGGDGKNTFNISTLAAFVVAGAGIPVAKHGNNGVSSISGSSNVLQGLGVQFTNDEGKLKAQIETAGICFLHAPLFHSAMKVVGPVRKELGVKTFFNMLGPLVNPARPKVQMTGVFSLELARIYKYLFEDEGIQYCIVHGLDGFDEVSLTDRFKLMSNQNEGVYQADDFGFDRLRLEEIHGGDTVPEAADIFIKILKNKGTQAQNRVVVANAALAIQCHKACGLSDAIQEAETSLYSGKALDSFTHFVNFS
jgi:anthranilate phosphoribosyltransferase